MWMSRIGYRILSGVFVIVVLLSGATGLAHGRGSVWGVGLSVGATFGLLSIALTILPSITLTMGLSERAWILNLLIAVVPLMTMLWLLERRAFLPALAAWLIVGGAWYLLTEVVGLKYVSHEVVSRVRSLGGDGRQGRALIVHHPGRSGFHTQLQEDFAEGLKTRGWQVDITTASRSAPTDLSQYDLLILGAPTYNLRPARPVTDYLERLGDLKGKPVVLVLTGDGTTDAAMRYFAARTKEKGGRVVERIEVWLERPNEERHSISDPHEIMRRAGRHLQISDMARTDYEPLRARAGVHAFSN